MPPAEVIMWSKLRGKNVKGYKFRRQYSVGTYIVDFYCAELESAGICFLRSTNSDVYERLDGALQTIMDRLP